MTAKTQQSKVCGMQQSSSKTEIYSNLFAYCLKILREQGRTVSSNLRVLRDYDRVWHMESTQQMHLST